MNFFDANACRFKNNAYLCIAIAKIAQLVEHNLAKVGVAGSSPVFRSSTLKYKSQTLQSINNRENSSVGRAQPCQGWGRGFESRFSLKYIEIQIANASKH